MDIRRQLGRNVARLRHARGWSQEDLAFESKLHRPGHAQGLHDLGFETFDALLGAFSAGPDELRAFIGPGPTLTDDKPLTEYFLSLPRDRNPDLRALKGDVRRYVIAE